MHGDRRVDAFLGGVGLLLVVAGLVALSNIQGEVVNTVVALSMLVWVVVISWRHRAVHRGGPGGWLLAMSWAALGFMLVWTVAQSSDTAAFDDGVIGGLGSLASSPPAVALMLPLTLAATAILRDSASAT